MDRHSRITALQLATRCEFPYVIHEAGRDRIVISAKLSTLSGRVYITFEDGEEIDVPQMCQLAV